MASARSESLMSVLERERKTHGLNSVLAYKWYMETLCAELGSEEGGKAMLLDKDTMTMMSMVYSMTEALKHNVYFMERLDKSSDRADKSTASLECIVFIRPTDMNVEFLCDELRSPHYARYHIVWNNIIQDKNKAKVIDKVARSDEYGLVASMKEFYGDFYAVHDSLFHFDLPLYSSMKSASVRTTDGLMALLLAHKRNPCIKYQASSERCAALAKALEARIVDQGDHMHFRQAEGTPTLFIMDRREDPVTPLLKPWGYQAMIHEHLQISYNRVSLKDRPGAKKGAEDYVMNAGFKKPAPEGARGEYLDESQDAFFANNMFKNFGEIGTLLKEAIEATAATGKLRGETASVEELQAMVAEMPEMRKKNMIAMKHWEVFKET